MQNLIYDWGNGINTTEHLDCLIVLEVKVSFKVTGLVLGKWRTYPL